MRTNQHDTDRVRQIPSIRKAPFGQGVFEQEFEFTIRLEGLADFDDGFSDAVFEAGCGDAMIYRTDGVVRMDFLREGSSLEDAIESAVSDIRRAGYNPVLVAQEAP